LPVQIAFSSGSVSMKLWSVWPAAPLAADFQQDVPVRARRLHHQQSDPSPDPAGS
jgi:hypothetical protein